MAANDMSIKQPMEAFIKHVDELRQTDENEVDGYDKEFRRVREESILCKAENRYPATEALKAVNLKKNRFKDIAPYDYTRVNLDKKDGVAGSDYINANFIKGVNGKPTYIASQGPLPHTTTDFWRMLWQYEIHVVIMVCREFEMERPRCHRYWPNKDETLTFDDISVTLIEEQHPDPDVCNCLIEEQHPDPDDQFVFRQLQAVHGEMTRTVHHLHFLAWPDRFVPSEVTHVIDLLAKAREFQTCDVPPIVVHCSAGCGRTGSLVVIDYVWNLLKTRKLPADFSLFDIIKTMRTQRPSFVQSEEQYYFVHKAVQFLFKEHLSLLNQYFPETSGLASYDNEVKGNTEQTASLSSPSLRIIQNTVKEWVTLPKEPVQAKRRLGSGSTEKPVISEKPNISKKPDIVTRSNTKPSDSTEGCAMKSSDSSKTTSKPQKITKPYEEVIMKPVGLGVKPSLQTSNTEAIRLVDRPPMPVPMAQSPSNESDLYSEVTAEDKCASHQDDGEYVDCYAATNRKEKWSLQHVALAGVTSASSPDDVICNDPSPFEPTIDYPSDESYDSESESPEVPLQSPGKLDSGFPKVAGTFSQSPAASMGQRTPGETVGSSVREAKTHDRRRRCHRHHRHKKPDPSQPIPDLPAPLLTWVFDKKIIYQGIDISFPNRVKKPIGPRKNSQAVKR
ncbi:Tyrosine-protein phosphatase non-receptor type 12 [Lamellibrachia satsuma]|nr:Tyrosine-protein phosphatase non-receptor type 12 [Lamellibrachia satsuma]